MNREKAIRLKFFDILNTGNIQYDSGNISIWDEKAEDTTNNLYILLRDQTASATQTFCQDTWDCTMEIVIVNKQTDTISKDINDDISEQVENLLFDALAVGATYEGWQIANVVLDSVNYSSLFLSATDSDIEKVLIYRMNAMRL